MRVAVAVLGFEVTRTSNSAEELCREAHMVRRYGTRERIHKLRLSSLKGRRNSALFFSLCGTSQHRVGDGEEERGGRPPLPFFFFSSPVTRPSC